MSRDHPTLLCDHCGYSLAGLEMNAACPECATPVAHADPRRIGTPWQRRVRWRWLRTTAGVLVRPWKTLGAITTWGTIGAWLFIINVAGAVAAPLLALAALWGYVLLRGYAHWYELRLMFEAGWIDLVLGSAMFVIATTGVAGLTTFLAGAVAQSLMPSAWRRTVAIAAHASFAWTAAGVTLGAHYLALWVRPELSQVLPHNTAAWLAIGLANLWFVILVGVGIAAGRPRVRPAPCRAVPA